MYNERLFLTPQEILDKEFKVDAKGYRPQEVDKFLDMVIRDYTEFNSIIRKQEKEKEIEIDFGKDNNVPEEADYNTIDINFEELIKKIG